MSSCEGIALISAIKCYVNYLVITNVRPFLFKHSNEGTAKQCLSLDLNEHNRQVKQNEESLEA